MKSSKFSLILMHDDGKTHRIRVGKVFFVLLTVLLLFLPALGGVGIWIGWNAWQYQQSWQLQQRVLEQSLAECRLQAERLSNVVHLAGLSTETHGTVPAAATLADSASSAAPSSTGSAPSSTGSPSGAAPATAPAPPPAVQPLPPTPEPVAEPKAEETPAIDTGVVRLENVVARGQDPRKLRVSLDLYNAKPNAGQISGNLSFALIDHDGKHHPLTHDDTAFRITRFKKVLVSATVPDALASSDNAALLITATSDGVTLLRKIFPVESR